MGGACHCLASGVNFIPGDGANCRRTGPARFLRLSVSSICMHMEPRAPRAPRCTPGGIVAPIGPQQTQAGGVCGLYTRASRKRA